MSMSCPFLATNLYVLDDGFELPFADERSDIGRRIETLTNTKRTDAVLELLHERLVHRSMHHDAAGGSTALTGRSKTAPDTSIDCQIQVGVIHHHDDVLAAHFEMDLLERRGGALGDRSAHCR